MSALSRRSFALLAATALSVALALPGHAEPKLESLELLAPSSPGSGYDQLARGVQQVLQADGLVPAVEVVNVAGGGGTVGLAQFLTAKPRKPTAMIVGFALVGGVLTTQSPVALEEVVPVARLMGEQDVLVVPANSTIRSPGWMPAATAGVGALVAVHCGAAAACSCSETWSSSSCANAWACRPVWRYGSTWQQPVYGGSAGPNGPGAPCARAALRGPSLPDKGTWG